MKNKELQELLKQYDDDIDVTVYTGDNIISDIIGLNTQWLKTNDLVIDIE